MNTPQQPTVAVLLATYNGARFIDEQIRSLSENDTPFTLHWLDDHSTDNTREAARSAALSYGVDLREWHQPHRLSVPGTFFELMDRVDADIYLFCDQDDIWQRGKIDATVANLLPDVVSPVLCFSDPLLFYHDEPETFYRLSDITHTPAPAALQDSRCFLCNPAVGQSIGFTRGLRDIYLKHKDIARTHAYMHSYWMYVIAVAVGGARMLSDVPVTLYRQHGKNASSAYYARSRNFISHIVSKWRATDSFRRGTSRQTRGFILASSTLPLGPNLDRLLGIASLVAQVDRRQSPLALARLLLRRTMMPNRLNQLALAAACLWSDAKPMAVKPLPVNTLSTQGDASMVTQPET